MSAKIVRHSSQAAARRTQASAWRQILAALAIFGLYVQLIAAGLCAAGSVAAADLTDFPICHTDVSNGTTPAHSGDHAPASQHSCPFCAIHCHAATATALAFAALAGRVAVATPASRRAAVTPIFARFLSSASPRGPPVLA